MAPRVSYLIALFCQHRDFPVQIKQQRALLVSPYFGQSRNKAMVATGIIKKCYHLRLHKKDDEPFPRFTAQTPITALLERNRAWADRQERDNPLLFPSLAHSQQPHILWIGCSDSRVPETTILGFITWRFICSSEYCQCC